MSKFTFDEFFGLRLCEPGNIRNLFISDLAARSPHPSRECRLAGGPERPQTDRPGVYGPADLFSFVCSSKRFLHYQIITVDNNFLRTWPIIREGDGIRLLLQSCVEIVTMV
jgi:hypothetical protein